MSRQTVGIKDVAREAGVSVGTVSNTFNRPDSVAPETRERIHAVIKRLGYVRSESARQLRVGHSRIIALLMLDLGNPFFVDLARGAERAAQARGLRVMMSSSAGSADEEAEYVNLFVEQRVRGVLVTPADATGTNLAALHRHRIPYVVVDRLVDDPHACSVSVDDVAGGELALTHLLALGHRRIAFVSGPSHLQQIRDRREGALRAIKAAGLPPQALHEIPTDHLDIASGRDAAARLLGRTERPTAVFCANDLLALGLQQALFATDVRVPEELAIVGYDDIEFAAAAAVPLTSVRQPAAEMGRIGVGMLVRETQAADNEEPHEHEHTVLQPELVVRASTMHRLPAR
ncbi:MAG: LacI family DNA-binding transcriptional regulator [Catenulispora sp.]